MRPRHARRAVRPPPGQWSSTRPASSPSSACPRRRIPDYLALVGDSADGFPGLPGWGAKSTAAVLGPLRAPRGHPAGRRASGTCPACAARPSWPTRFADQQELACCSGASRRSRPTWTSAPWTTGAGPGRPRSSRPSAPSSATVGWRRSPATSLSGSAPAVRRPRSSLHAGRLGQVRGGRRAGPPPGPAGRRWHRRRPRRRVTSRSRRARPPRVGPAPRRRAEPPRRAGQDRRAGDRERGACWPVVRGRSQGVCALGWIGLGQHHAAVSQEGGERPVERPQPDATRTHQFPPRRQRRSADLVGAKRPEQRAGWAAQRRSPLAPAAQLVGVGQVEGVEQVLQAGSAGAGRVEGPSHRDLLRPAGRLGQCVEVSRRPQPTSGVLDPGPRRVGGWDAERHVHAEQHVGTKRAERVQLGADVADLGHVVGHVAVAIANGDRDPTLARPDAPVGMGHHRRSWRGRGCDGWHVSHGGRRACIGWRATVRSRSGPTSQP